ncbi:MAG: type I restriction enzyme HsdR N-terminal domain-containing protein [Cyanobacteria bacterium CAN_BIN43]|nr:type I restriction enzyme HsdR N-terminal domain-containing protein [Cyanobacteria bacterium CAN_BIN43]
MVQSIPVSDLTLADVEDKFGLRCVEDDSFFLEWQQDSPEISDVERQALDQIKSSFLYLSKYSMSEEAVKLVMISPLLSMAGFYNPPFRIKTEAPIQIALEDEGKLVRGRIDILVLQERFWVVVVESKEAGFSLKDAIAQALSHMMATPHPHQPAYGLATNGSEFRFIKLTAQQSPQYGLSDLLTLQRRENDLYGVLRVLRRVGILVQAS